MIGILLRELWPDAWLPDPAYLEIRTIRGGRIKQEFFDAREPWRDELVEDYCADRSWHGEDVYFGVLPRTARVGTNANVPDTTPFLWADIDAKKADPESVDGGKAIALARINGFSTPPHLIVDSGGGYHCYWLLDQPAQLGEAQVVMRWIAKSLSGDFVQDGARILRVPGTLNQKREIKPVARFLRFQAGAPRIRLADLEGQIPVERERRPAALRTRVENLPEWLHELLRDGAPKGSRSEASFRAMVWLVRYGRTREEVRDLFQFYSDGIGSKMAEKSGYDADRWFDYTFDAAEGAA